MKLSNIDGQLFEKMIISAANCLENNKAIVNSLNVFPVPDGDTGTNMSMTMMSAVKEIQKLKNHSIEVVAEAAATGSLMGARGNSGVILSQLLRGISKGIKGKSSLSAVDFAFALKEGANTAYKAVMKPTEGTILTVARESSEKAVELSQSIDDTAILMQKIIDYAGIILDKTPSMLPVLKKAGVVDAGGKGLIYIYSGMLAAMNGTLDTEVHESPASQQDSSESKIASDEEIVYGYCTEFIIKNTKSDPLKFREQISPLGDSIIVVGGDDIIKVHIHTNDPGKVLSNALKLGELTKIKVDNMREQHRGILDTQEENADMAVSDTSEDEENSDPKKAGVITVASGEGIRDIFLNLGADRVIEGGQTMNPSTEDILNAINEVNASDVYILPNNGNIVMAAKQASTLSEKNVFVIPTKSIPQGISALTVFNPDSESNENVDMMTSSMEYVKTGQVTYAVRDTVFDDRKINEGDILGLINGKINNTGKNITEVAQALVENMLSQDDELITILYGKDISSEDADKFSEVLKAKYPECEIQAYDGGQPLYYYIISVE